MNEEPVVRESRKEIAWLRRRLVEASHAQKMIIVEVPPVAHSHSINRHYDLGDGHSGHFSVVLSRDGQICVLGVMPADGIPLFPDHGDHINVRSMVKSRDFRHGAPTAVLAGYLSYDKRNEVVIIAWINWLKHEMDIVHRAKEDSSGQVVKKAEPLVPEL